MPSSNDSSAFDDFLDLLRNLIREPSVVGAEDSFFRVLLRELQDRFTGQRVQAHLPYTGTCLGQGSITRSYICPYRNNLIFEIDGLGFLQPGTPVSFLDRLSVQDGSVSGQLDKVLSVALLVLLFRRGFQGTVLFTAQEEAGRSWRCC